MTDNRAVATKRALTREGAFAKLAYIAPDFTEEELNDEDEHGTSELILASVLRDYKLGLESA